MAPRTWGWWTRHKLEILEDYLKAFARASSRAKERIYLDLFAGTPKNQDRDTNEEILGSVHRALAVKPPFTRICLFELEPMATELKQALWETYPSRSEIKVYSGDCNRKFPRAAADLASVRWAPTFAFIDQYDNEVRWKTLQQISRFRKPGLPKTEMWILLGTSFYPRGLRTNQPIMDTSYANTLTAMFGCNGWEPIIKARREGRLTPAQTRDELVNLMRWRLENELNYRASHPFVMYNTNGTELYHMIFVSDHEAGDRIMCDLYGRALLRNERMREHALALRREKRKAEKFGAEPLIALEEEMFHLDDKKAKSVYEPESPKPPYGSAERGGA